MARLSRRGAAALVAAALLAACACPAALACIGVKDTIADTGLKPAKPIMDGAYKLAGVKQHIESLVPITDFRPNAASTFSCVDSRGEVPQLGAFGGDMGELAAATYAYLNQVGDTKTMSRADIDKAVAAIFNAFMDQVITPERPFYFHTSDEKLHKVFHSLEDAGVDPAPVVFPDVKPTGDQGELWLTKLVNGSFQGCGHIRLMIDMYPDYGMDSPAVPQALIKAFFNYWWPTESGSDERQKVAFIIKQGPLDGHAVTIVDSAGACPGLSPAVSPSQGGSQVFVFHSQAVDDFRKNTLVPFFVKYAKAEGKAIDATKFYNDLKSLQSGMLGATLKNLAPANALPIYSVTFAVQKGGPNGDAPTGSTATVTPRTFANAAARNAGNLAFARATAAAATSAPATKAPATKAPAAKKP